MKLRIFPLFASTARSFRASSTIALTCASLLGSAALSQAEVLVSEDFTYANGALNGQNGGTGFSAAWSNSTSVNVTGGAVVSTGGNNPSFRNLSTAFGNSGTLWVSFDWGHNTGAVGYGGLTLWAGLTEVGLIGDVYNGTWQVNGAGASSTSALSSLKTGVARITLGAGATSTIDLWVGPTGSPVDVSGPVVSTLSGLTLEGVDNIRIMGDSAQSFDNLIIGTTIADVDAFTSESGTWTNAAGGLWGTAGNWSGNVVANGSGGTADFGTLNITADTTVNLDSARTVGDLFFGDTNPSSAAGWTLANNGNAANILTLAGTTPPITVDALGGTKTVEISAVVAGSNGLTKGGTGTLTLSGANIYGGQTDITEGTLLAANNTALGAGGFNGATMTFIQDGTTLALQGGISLDEHLHVWGSGVGGLGAVRSLSGNNALTTSYLGGAGYSLRSSATIGVDADTLSITGFYQEDGSYGLTKVGAGTLTMTAASNYTGGTTISEGTIIAGAGGVAKGAVTIASGATLSTTSAASNGLAALYYNNSPVQANFASLPALLARFGPNSPAPSQVNTATSMNFGNNGSGFPSPYNNGALGFAALYSGKINIATAGTYTFNTSSDDGSMIFIDGQVVVTNNFDQGYPGSTKSGSIALTAGMHDIVIAYNQGGGGYGMTARISGADDTNMVDINTGNASITPDLVVGSLAGAGNVALTTGNLITGIDDSSTSFSGTISGIGSVTKFGTGVQTLTGTLSYGGSTSVQGGTLAVVGSLPAASSVTVGSGGTLNPGTVGATGTLNAGNTTFAGTLAIDLNGSSSDALVVTGNLSLGSGSTLAINELAVPAAAPYTVATYSGTLTGTFTNPPTGYTVNYGTGSNSAITITKSSSDYDTWGAPYGLASGSEGGDLDNDGVTNFEEYAFGLIPNSGSSVNPIASTLNKSTKKFSYTRRTGTGLSYSVWFSENLVGWTNDTGVTEGTPVPSGDNETVEVTLSALPGNPLPAKLFIQVRAD